MGTDAERFYGWSAPVRLGIYGTLAAFLVGSLLALQLTQVVLTHAWGAPSGPALADVRWTRPLLMGAAIVIAAVRWRKSLRTLPCVFVLAALGSTPLYSPHFVVLGLAGILHEPRLSDVAVMALGLALGAGLAGLVARTLRDSFRVTTTSARGSTRWGRAEVMKRTAGGLLLGKQGTEMLRYDGDGHLITIAATRSGKGVGAIIPNLLNYPGSIVVTDPKGENYYVTARYRRERLSQQVVALDPFDLTLPIRTESWSFNPLDLVNTTGDDYVETAMMLADMMIVGRGTASEPFWEAEAKALLYTFILYAAASSDPAKRTLIEVRRLLTLNSEDLKETLAAMMASPIPQVAEGARRIEQKAEKEASGVFSTAQSHTHVLSSPRIQRVIATTTVDLAALRSGMLSLYLVLPREHLSTFAPWLRLMIACCYYACTHDALYRERGPRVLFLLDEFANLGYMANIKEAVSLGGGYGISLWLILQDLAQLRRAYRHEWESFVANSDVIQTFSVQDPFTSEKIARMLGETTIWQRRMRRSSRREGGRIVEDYDEQSRALLRHDELRRLHPRRQVILARPYQPVIADKITYYKDRYFEGRFDPNPYITPLTRA